MNTKPKLSKNEVIITFIAIFLLITLVSAATFAYFGSFSTNLNNKLHVNITTENGVTSTFTTGGAILNLTVPPAKMAQLNNGTLAASSNANLSVKLNSASSSIKMECTYDIVFEYQSGSKVYGLGDEKVTTAGEKELTMKAIGNSGTNKFAEETNVDFNTSNGWVSATSSKGANIILVSDAKITSEGTENVSNWNFEFKFYNLEARQAGLENKNFVGKIYAVSKGCINIQ